MNNTIMKFDDFPFYSYSRYLKGRYGASAYRVAVDGGFSCPNRNPDRTGGCSYCDELGSTAVYQRGQEADLAYGGSSSLQKQIEAVALPSECYNPDMESRKLRIRKQLETSTEFIKRRYGSKYFLLYFQAFSNTFAPVKELKELYDYSLSLMPFKELIISTRPDTLSLPVVELLSSYRDKGLDVWVELGLQSSSDHTLRHINRGHSVKDFLNAYRLLTQFGIKTTVHLIFGLPGEGYREIMSSVDFVASLKPEGIKIHNLHIPIGTELFSEYLMGELTVPSGFRHLEYTIEAIERLPRSTIVHRLTCDTPAHRLGAPRTFFKKGTFYNLLIQEMQLRGVSQGELYRSP